MRFTLKIFLIALSSVIITSHLTWKNTPASDYTFEHYKLEFNKSYNTEAEHKMREMKYNESLQKVNQINSDPKFTWKAAINHLSDRMVNERNSLMGRNRNLSFLNAAPQVSQVLKAKKSYYRIQAPSSHLKVESCRDIDSDTYGDKEGTCAEHGYGNICYSCMYNMEFIVKNAGTCDQEHTECYFKSADEVCFGSSQCPWKNASLSQVLEAKKSYYRLQAPSSRLKVESCRDIDSGIYGDKEGTCAEQGYGHKCLSCMYLMEFIVKDAGTCDQKHTECYFKSADEVCHGSLQCPWMSTKNTNQSTLKSSEHFLKQLPSHVDWREQGVTTPVKNQGGCGSCWAFSVSAVLESHISINNPDKSVIVSPQELVDCVENPKKCGGTGGCQGATQEIGFEYIQNNGLSLDSEYPYFAKDMKCQAKEHKRIVSIGSFTKLPVNDYNMLFQTVAINGPVAISVAANEWFHYDSGVFNSFCGTTVNHAVTLEGYGTENGNDYWLVRNSWGESWGEKGYIKVMREKSADEVVCGTDKNPHDGSACEGGPDEITVCGHCGILADSSVPMDAKVIK